MIYYSLNVFKHTVDTTPTNIYSFAYDNHDIALIVCSKIIELLYKDLIKEHKPKIRYNDYGNWIKIIDSNDDKVFYEIFLIDMQCNKDDFKLMQSMHRFEAEIKHEELIKNQVS